MYVIFYLGGMCYVIFDSGRQVYVIFDSGGRCTYEIYFLIQGACVCNILFRGADVWSLTSCSVGPMLD